MQNLTEEGARIASELVQRHGFSSDAVTHMMFAVLAGNGSMAQFNHSEFAGGGQWMRGGMLMLGDMFNSQLKGRVDSLCNEISSILANQPGLLRSGSFQSQSQGGASHQSQATGDFVSKSNGQNQSSLFEPDVDAQWWSAELGDPTAVGSQNNVAYAYFPDKQRLAVKTGDQIWVYDTLNHQMGGFSQQQSTGGSIIFSSQFGAVNLSTLPVVSRNGMSQKSSPVSSVPRPSPSQPAGPFDSMSAADTELSGNEGTTPTEILDAVERLGELFEKGILTADEFTLKKHELLDRL